jgi:hypothetical protein
MTTDKEQKIKKLLEKHIPGTVSLASWLEGLGISRDLQGYYRRSGWLNSIGTGAFIRPNDTVGWEGGLYALQIQAELPVHVGALTALSMHGLAHYLRLNEEKIFLFSPPKTILPTWFRNHNWQHPIHHTKTSILPNKTGLIAYEEKIFTIAISVPERAMLECLYLAPDNLDLMECYQVMEGLANLRPKLVQVLLEKCSSVKVKRLFLYMADKAGHQWLPFVDRSKIDLGKGDRKIANGGMYISGFHISIPKELAEL